MKKIITMMAVLALASTGLFAGSWSYTGEAEFKTTLFESTSGGDANPTTLFSKGEHTFAIELSNKINDKTSFTIGADTDGKPSDNSFGIGITHVANEYVTVGVAGNLSHVIDSTGGDLKVAIDDGDGVYIKLTNLLDGKLSLTLYPVEAGTGIGDEIESDGTLGNPGFALDLKPMDELSLGLVVNAKAYDTEKDSLGVVVKKANAFGVKVSAGYAKDDLSANLEFVTNTQATDNDKYLASSGLSALKSAVDVRGSYKIDKATLNAEVYYSMLNEMYTKDAKHDKDVKDDAKGDDYATSGMGVFVKGAYDIGELACFTSSDVYASFKMMGEGIYSDGNELNGAAAKGWYDKNRGTEAETDYVKEEELLSNAYNDIAVGVNLGYHGLNINPEFSMQMAEEIYDDKDKKATGTKMSFTIGTSMSF